MSQLRASDSYIWSLSDVLGQGATGAVYMARHKRTGEQYAVKVFNHFGQMRPFEVQMREFDVLRKLDHKNIVRLLAVEEEQSSRLKVLVMELCKGGSLYNMLDDPANAYGLEETEFLRVLQHVAAGMNHLRDQGVVHRDIKPGNILKFVEPDGSSVYKLTDFGAARELDDKEQFMSLYGTEEYLRPDMYERALLDGPHGQQFDATVDLWSLGVTFYHLATGELPFRPYGGRRNRLTMHKITTQKASGVISGIQRYQEGPIDWSRELPATCRLSKGLRHLLTPLLAGLLESNPRRMLTFDAFFAQANNISSKKVIHVYFVHTFESLCIYLEPTVSLVKLKEEIAKQTEINASSQLLLCDRGLLMDHVTAIQKVSDYPVTTRENPLYLCVLGASQYPVLSFQLPAYMEPPSGRGLAVEEDFKYVKGNCGIIYLIKHCAQDFSNKMNCTVKVVDLFRAHLRHIIDHLREFTTSLVSESEMLETHSKLEGSLCSQQLQMLNMSGGGDAQLQQQARDELQMLNMHQQACSQSVNTARKLRETANQCYAKVLSQQLDGNFTRDIRVESDNKRLSRTAVIAKEAESILRNFKKDRELKRLSHNEEQLHKFEKNKFKQYCQEAKLLFDQFVENLRMSHAQFSSWYNAAFELHREVRATENETSKEQETQQVISSEIQRVLGEFRSIISSIMNCWPENKLTTKQVTRVSSSGPSGQARSLDSYRIDMKELNKDLALLENESNEFKAAMRENSDLLERIQKMGFNKLPSTSSQR